jgi:hypothetical protein
MSTEIFHNGVSTAFPKTFTQTMVELLLRCDGAFDSLVRGGEFDSIGADARAASVPV